MEYDIEIVKQMFDVEEKETIEIIQDGFIHITGPYEKCYFLFEEEDYINYRDDETFRKNFDYDLHFHNDKGPCMILNDGFPVWGLKGVNVRTFSHWCKLTNKTEEEITLLKLQYGTYVS